MSMDLQREELNKQQQQKTVSNNILKYWVYCVKSHILKSLILQYEFFPFQNNTVLLY